LGVNHLFHVLVLEDVLLLHHLHVAVGNSLQLIEVRLDFAEFIGVVFELFVVLLLCKR
jgi:hypothetical protein